METIMKQETKPWGIEYWHGHFKWMRWEPGDPQYTKAEADERFKDERARGATVRIVRVSRRGG